MQKEHRPTVNLGQYELFSNEALGQGATGTVYKGQEVASRKTVAIKHIDLATIRDDATKSLLQNEIKALKLLSHPNVLSLCDIVEKPGNLYIVTEVLEGGTLKEYLANKGALDEFEAMNLFKSILAGCTAIIEGGVIHRDLKPANLMLHGNVPKVIDFGFCEVILGGGVVRAFNVGSPAYMAPEALLKTLYSQKSDSWSLGVILFEMLHGQTPDKGMDTKEFLERVRTNPSLVKESIKTSLHKNTREIIEKSLSYKAEDRMSINGMKYLADVFMLQNKGRSVPSVVPSSYPRTPAAPQFEKKTSVESHLAPVNLTSANIPTRESFKRVEPERNRSKFTSSIMYTQLPGKKMKENEKITPMSSQFISVPPSHPNIRMAPLSFTKGQSTQPPNGFISFSEFVRPPSMPANDIRKSGGGQSGKTTSAGQESIEGAGSLREVLGDCNWRSGGSSKQVMERPPGKPMYRQVTVRYL